MGSLYEYTVKFAHSGENPFTALSWIITGMIHDNPHDYSTCTKQKMD